MHNQTEQSWLENLEPDALGTGVLLIQGDDKASEEVQKTFMQNITYDQCIQHGKNAVAFKWVPHKLASYEELINTTCNMPTSEE